MKQINPYITIAIGYGWAKGNVRSDKRWAVMRNFCWQIHYLASRRYILANTRMTWDDEGTDQATIGSNKNFRKLCDSVWPKAFADSMIYRMSVKRLRASVGYFIWDSITERLRDADVLLFDLTPRESEGIPANVLLELGVALGTTPCKPVFAVVENVKRFLDSHYFPSDLQGLLIGEIPTDKPVTDNSLRMRLIGEVFKIAEQRLTVTQTGCR